MDLQGLSGIFLEGILSFFSPCVLPLIPLYMSYLAGEHKRTDEDGNIHYEKAKVFLSTFFFVLGICLTFFLLCISLNILKEFLDRYAQIISIIGGTLLVIRDSYAHCFAPFTCGLFDEVDMVDPRYYNASIQDLIASKSYTDILLLFNAAGFAEETALARLLV